MVIGSFKFVWHCHTNQHF